mmetsp:Transcript_106889/g.312502  ORF Transcript_106889/g.312502 Transcript_106889/m.312502 type:complete len:228 (+) Transcript_106889:280-963(+)
MEGCKKPSESLRTATGLGGVPGRDLLVPPECWGMATLRPGRRLDTRLPQGRPGRLPVRAHEARGLPPDPPERAPLRQHGRHGAVLAAQPRDPDVRLHAHHQRRDIWQRLVYVRAGKPPLGGRHIWRIPGRPHVSESNVPAAAEKVCGWIVTVRGPHDSSLLGRLALHIRCWRQSKAYPATRGCWPGALYSRPGIGAKSSLRACQGASEFHNAPNVQSQDLLAGIGTM